MFRCLIWPCVGVAVLWGTPSVAAQEQVPHRQELVAALAQSLDTSEFAGPLSFKEFLTRLQSRIKIKGRELPLWVDVEAFKEGMEAGADLYDSEIKLPPYLKHMTAAALLGHALSKIPGGNATYYVKNGLIVVTTAEEAQARRLCSEAVEGKFEAQPMGEVLQELAAQTGLHLMVDGRIAWRLKAKISANFSVNETALGTALYLLTDMVELRVAFLGNVAYVTSPANARQIGNWLFSGNFEVGRRMGVFSRKEAME